MLCALLMGDRELRGGQSSSSLVRVLVAQGWAGRKWPGGKERSLQVENPLEKPGGRCQCLCSEGKGGGHVIQGQEGHLTGFVGATPGML